MNNTLSDPARPARLNSNRIEISKDHPKNEKGTEKTANNTSQKLANNGFDPSQITCVVDEIIGNQVQHPWEDDEGWKPRPDLKPLIDNLVKPFTNMNEFVKPALTPPTNPFPAFPISSTPIVRQPEFELNDPGLTANHNNFNAVYGDVSNNITYQDIDGEIAVDGIEITDVDQGQVADCYLLAVLGSIALHNPDYIENMITDNGNGTYTVSFGGEFGDVTVDDDFAVLPNGNIAYAQMGDQSNPELWVAIIEKAYVQANRNTENGNVRNGSYSGIEFGSSSIAMENITGQSSTSIEASALTPESLRAALTNGHSVVLNTPGVIGEKTQTSDGLWRSHSYVLTDVRLNSKGKWEVEIYNPHGSNNGTQNPVTVLTMDQFNTNFQSAEITDEPVS